MGSSAFWIHNLNRLAFPCAVARQHSDVESFNSFTRRFHLDDMSIETEAPTFPQERPAPSDVEQRLARTADA